MADGVPREAKPQKPEKKKKKEINQDLDGDKKIQKVETLNITIKNSSKKKV